MGRQKMLALPIACVACAVAVGFGIGYLLSLDGHGATAVADAATSGLAHSSSNDESPQGSPEARAEVRRFQSWLKAHHPVAYKEGRGLQFFTDWTKTQSGWHTMPENVIHVGKDFVPPPKMLAKCKDDSHALPVCGILLAVASGKLKPKGDYTDAELETAVARAGFSWHP